MTDTTYGLPRLDRIENDQGTVEQRAVYDELLSERGKPGGRLANLYAMMVHCPPVAKRMGKIGAYCRFHAKPSDLVREATILTACYILDFDYETRAHEEIIQNRGMSAEDVSAIKTKRWGELPHDVALGARFARAALSGEKVPDRLFAEVVSEFGIDGMLDLTTMAGHYSSLSVFGRVLQPEIDPSGYSLTRPDEVS